jgi:hypothetical protein
VDLTSKAGQRKPSNGSVKKKPSSLSKNKSDKRVASIKE